MPGNWPLTVTPGPADRSSQTYYVTENGKRHTVVHSTVDGQKLTWCCTCYKSTCIHADLIRTTIEALK